MAGRVKTGIEGLDEVIGGGFPRGSLILLAGEPGTGKTVFSVQFLAKGAELGEPGVYAGFAEAKETLVENSSRHLGVDLAGLEAEGKLKFLDYTTMKEGAVSTLLEAILGEVEALKAKRLVVDSFSAMAQAFKEPIDVRMVTNTVLGRIVRGMDCTTLMVEEVPIGESRIGFGLEEFVADGVLRLRRGSMEGRLLRDLELIKLRGCELKQDRLVFTLKDGFNVHPPYRPKLVEEPRRFQPIPDPQDKYSTGSEDLDAMLGGGIPKGSAMLLELDEKISTLEYHLLLIPMTANFIVQGRGVMIVPSSGVDSSMLRGYVKVYGGTEEEFNRYVRMIERPGFTPVEAMPNVITVKNDNLEENIAKFVEVSEELMKATGHPNLTIVGVDRLIDIYGEKTCERILNSGATSARRIGAVFIAVLKAGYRPLAVKLSSIADVYLRLTKRHGCLLLYGVKPRTGLYAVEMDTSKGHPLPKLTPIV